MKRAAAFAAVFLIGLAAGEAGASECPVCKGGKTRDCPVCYGERKVDAPCRECGGDGMAPCPNPACRKKGVKGCEFCFGRGERTCRAKNCKAGKIKVECGRCKGSGILPCRECGGTGILEEEETPAPKGPSPSRIREIEERLDEAESTIEEGRARLEEIEAADREIAEERKAVEASIEELEAFARLYPDLGKSAGRIRRDWRDGTEEAAGRAAAALEEVRTKEKESAGWGKEIEEIRKGLEGISTENLLEAKKAARHLESSIETLSEKLKIAEGRQESLLNIIGGMAPRVREARAAGEKLAAELREVEEGKRRVAASFEAFDASFRAIPLPGGFPELKTALLPGSRSPDALNVLIAYVDDGAEDAEDLRESPPEPTEEYVRHVPAIFRAAFAALPSPANVKVAVEVVHRDDLGNRAPAAFQSFSVDAAKWKNIGFDLREEWEEILRICKPYPPYPRERPPLSHLALMIFLAAIVSAVGAAFLAVLRFVRR